MTNLLLIEPIQFGELQEKRANAITWQISSIHRGSTSATAECSLIWAEGINTWFTQNFTVEIDNDTLQAWGPDDTVIDNKILQYSPLFIKRNS